MCSGCGTRVSRQPAHLWPLPTVLLTANRLSLPIHCNTMNLQRDSQRCPQQAFLQQLHDNPNTKKQKTEWVGFGLVLFFAFNYSTGMTRSTPENTFIHVMPTLVYMGNTNIASTPGKLEHIAVCLSSKHPFHSHSALCTAESKAIRITEGKTQKHRGHLVLTVEGWTWRWGHFAQTICLETCRGFFDLERSYR